MHLSVLDLCNLSLQMRFSSKLSRPHMHAPFLSCASLPPFILVAASRVVTCNSSWSTASYSPQCPVGEPLTISVSVPEQKALLTGANLTMQVRLRVQICPLLYGLYRLKYFFNAFKVLRELQTYHVLNTTTHFHPRALPHLN